MASQIQNFNFLTRESFERILETFISQRKNKRCLMDESRYNECLNVLKNPNAQHNPSFKYWVIHTFKILIIGSIEELHVIKQDANNLGTQVCIVENFYEVICSAHQATEHGGQEKMWKKAKIYLYLFLIF